MSLAVPVSTCGSYTFATFGGLCMPTKEGSSGGELLATGQLSVSNSSPNHNHTHQTHIQTSKIARFYTPLFTKQKTFCSTSLIGVLGPVWRCNRNYSWAPQHHPQISMNNLQIFTFSLVMQATACSRRDSVHFWGELFRSRLHWYVTGLVQDKLSHNHKSCKGGSQAVFHLFCRVRACRTSPSPAPLFGVTLKLGKIL